MVFRVLLYAFLIYIGYKLIVDFIIPVFIAGRKIRKGFREMHQRMEEQMNQQANAQAAPQNPAPKAGAGDYIEFEEIK